MKRSGFTLVELTVVMGIIATVLALLVPALRGGAEAARRCQCLNNLKQIHLALQSYHATHSVYPPGVTDDNRPLTPANATRRQSWVAMTLPWTEQTYLYNAINFDHRADDPSNTTARLTWMSALLCPDSTPDRSLQHAPPWPWQRRINAPAPAIGASCYAACHHDVEKVIDVNDNGVFHLNSRVRAADVFDGLSQTIFIGELSAPTADGWLMGGRATLRNTGTTINDAIPRGSETQEYVGGFGSKHRGDGANFAFGDGSVRLLRRSIDPDVYRRLGNRDDGEEVGDDAY